MRFFDREREIAYLRAERSRQNCGARMTVVSGRRRIGKTQLIKRAMEDEPYLYFLVTRRSEADQCQDFLEKAKENGRSFSEQVEEEYRDYEFLITPIGIIPNPYYKPSNMDAKGRLMI